MISKRFTKILVFALMLFTIINCENKKTKVSTDKVEVTFKKEGILELKKTRTDSLITTLDIEIADTEYEVQTGLMYRNKLAKNHGMLFIFPKEDYRSFYMKNTKIPLDIIYINSNKEIVSFQKNTKPLDETSLPSDALAKYVLEVYAGLSDEWQLEIGDKVDFKILN